MFWYFLLTFIAGFASGIAFWKHKADLQIKILKEAAAMKQSVERHL